MRIEQLQYFTEIAKTGSIRKAADNLFISSPALSTAIHNLEKELGFPLFKRQHSGVVLTSYGQKALDLSQHILEITSKFDNIAQEYQFGSCQELTGNLSISLTIAANQYYLRDILPVFSKINPKVCLTIIQHSSPFVLDDIFTDRSDLGILFCDDCAIKELESENDLVFKLLYYDKCYALVGNTSPLFHRKSLTLEELVKYPLALTAAIQNDTYTYDKLFSKFGDIHIMLYTNNIELIEQYVLKHRAIGLAFDRSREAHYENIAAIPIQDVPSFPTYAIYKSSSSKLAVIDRFIQTVIEFSSL